MILRRTEDNPRRAARRPLGWRLVAACAGAAVLLGVFAGGSGASLSDYSGTLYLTKTASSIGTGNWQLSTSAPSSVDKTSQNRVNFSVTGGPTGYVPFAPGVTPCGTCNNTPSASISVTSCTGWIVDGSGGMTFPAGTWTFRAMVDDPNNANGQAHLTAALYTVDASGSIVATIVSPTDGSTNLIRSSPPATPTTTETISASASGFSLSASQHLCLMFWRDQTAGYTSGGASTHLFKLDVNDGTAAITGFPAPDGFPSATLSSAPADASYVNASGTVTLGATYSDPESESGSVDMQVCPTSACASQQATTTFNGVASGSSVTWSPSLPDGTWYWRARATDTVGGQSWSATHSFTLDTTVPSTPALVSPADASSTNSLALQATFSDPSVSDTGTVEFRLCSDAFCSSVITSGTSTSVANGATATWTIGSALSDGTYSWEARAHDAADNKSVWSAARWVTFDRTPPTTTIDSGPAQPSTSANANFTFHASESATFECNLDGAGWGTACTSPKAYAGLADGSHTLQIRGTDGVGNVGTAASYTWSIDTTVPSSPSLTSPADGALVNAVPQLAGTFADPTAGDTGVVDFRVCTSAAGAGSACSGLVQSASSTTVTSPGTGTYTPSGLADGTYDWQARARDTAGNQSGWTATRSFTLDSTPPNTSIGPTEPAAHTNSTTATFDFSSTETGSTFKCSFDGGAFAACSSPVTYSSLSEATHTFSVEAIDQAGNTDPSPATYSWTVDLTPPNTSIGPTEPAAVSTSSSATFDFSSNESSTFECDLDGAAWTSCSSPKIYSALSEANHTFQVRATDLAGNVDATPASYAWYVDTSVPATPTLVAPSDGYATNVLPQFRATFTDPNATDSGTVEFRICSSAAAAGATCAGVVDDAASAVVASGMTATYTPASLPNAQLYWQARAQDNAGNRSTWTATRSFIYDTNTPDVPTLEFPASGAWANTTKVTAKFNEPAFAGTGWIEFRICTDAVCLAVASSAASPTVPNGTSASWDGAHLVDGYYWWEARAHDAAGNVSAWSSPWGFHLDETPPAAPTHFNGTIAANGLTLRWDPPVDSIANFVVYVNGDSGPYLGGTTYEYNVGTFDAGDTRTFTVRAVDQAGNFGAMSTVLVGVPNLVGLTLGEAQQAMQVRGLVLRSATSLRRAAPSVIVAQDPAPGSVEEKGSSVHVVVKQAEGNRAMTLRVSPTRVTCAPGSVFHARLHVSDAARVRALVVGRKGVITTRSLGHLEAGDHNVSVRLPRQHVAKVVFVAVSDDGRIGGAAVSVSSGNRGCSARR